MPSNVRFVNIKTVGSLSSEWKNMYTCVTLSSFLKYNIRPTKKVLPVINFANHKINNISNSTNSLNFIEAKSNIFKVARYVQISMAFDVYETCFFVEKSICCKICCQYFKWKKNFLHTKVLYISTQRCCTRFDMYYFNLYIF